MLCRPVHLTAPKRIDSKDDDHGQRPSVTDFHSCTKMLHDQGMQLLHLPITSLQRLVGLISRMSPKQTMHLRFTIPWVLYVQ